MQIVTQQEDAEDERRLQAAILASLRESGPTGVTLDEDTEAKDEGTSGVDDVESSDSDNEMDQVD